MSILASCSTSVKFHRWPTGIHLGSVDINDDDICVRSLSWDRAGKRVVAVPTSGTPMLITLPRGDNGDIISEHLETTRVNAADFSKVEKDTVVFGTSEGKVYLYDVNQRKMMETYPSVPNEVHFLEFGYRDKLLAAGSMQGQIILYNRRNVFCASFVVPHSYSLSCMSFHKRDAALLGAASKEGIVTIWNTEDGNMLLVRQSHNSVVSDVAFHPAYKNIFASVGLDKKFICNDLRMSTDCIKIETLDIELSALAFMENKSEMVIGTTCGQLICYDWRNLKVPLSTHIPHTKSVRKVAFQIDYTRDFREEVALSNNQDTAESSYIESSSFSDVESTPAEEAKAIENKIPSGIDVRTENSKDAIKRALERELEQIREEVIGELYDLHEKFENYMSRCFFEMKMEVSKRCIVLEEEVGKRIESLVKTRKKKSSNSDASRTGSKISMSGSDSASRVSKLQTMDN